MKLSARLEVPKLRVFVCTVPVMVDQRYELSFR